MGKKEWIVGGLTSAFASVAATGLVVFAPAQQASADMPQNNMSSSFAPAAPPPLVPTDYRFPDEQFVKNYAEKNSLPEKEAWNIANNAAGRPLEFDQREACYRYDQVRHVYERAYNAPKIKEGEPGYTGPDSIFDSIEENIAAAHYASIVDQAGGRSYLKLFDEDGKNAQYYKVDKHVERRTNEGPDQITYRFSSSSGSDELEGYNVSDTLQTYGLWHDTSVKCEISLPPP